MKFIMPPWLLCDEGYFRIVGDEVWVGHTPSHWDDDYLNYYYHEEHYVCHKSQVRHKEWRDKIIKYENVDLEDVGRFVNVEIGNKVKFSCGKESTRAEYVEHKINKYRHLGRLDLYLPEGLDIYSLDIVGKDGTITISTDISYYLDLTGRLEKLIGSHEELNDSFDYRPEYNYSHIYYNGKFRFVNGPTAYVPFDEELGL